MAQRFNVYLLIEDAKNKTNKKTFQLSPNRKPADNQEFERQGLPEKCPVLVSRQGAYIPHDIFKAPKTNGKAKG